MTYDPPAFDADAAALHGAIKSVGMPVFEMSTPEAARDWLAASRAAGRASDIPVQEVRDLVAGGVPVRLYRPAAGVLPVTVFLHGGGWVVGGLDSHDALCRAFAVASGAAVLAVDYRLAPEHPFPAGLEDGAEVLRWVAAEGAAEGLDAGRVALAGDSAGGNLAATLALMARDGGLPVPRLSVLLCPVLDCTLDHPSHALQIEGLPVNGSTMRWFRDHYIGAADPADWRASPLLAPSLEGLGAVSLVTAGLDPLCDEGLAFAARLSGARVAFTHRHFPGQIHGFVTAGFALPRAQALIRAVGAELAAALAA